MITIQSKKHKKFRQKLVFKPVDREPDQIDIHRKSPIRNSNLWRYFFRRVNMAKPGLLDFYGNRAVNYKYFPKPDKKKGVKRVDIINRANFLNANGFYKHQRVEE